MRLPYERARQGLVGVQHVQRRHLETEDQVFPLSSARLSERNPHRGTSQIGGTPSAFESAQKKRCPQKNHAPFNKCRSRGHGEEGGDNRSPRSQEPPAEGGVRTIMHFSQWIRNTRLLGRPKTPGLVTQTSNLGVYSSLGSPYRDTDRDLLLVLWRRYVVNRVLASFARTPNRRKKA